MAAPTPTFTDGNALLLTRHKAGHLPPPLRFVPTPRPALARTWMPAVAYPLPPDCPASLLTLPRVYGPPPSLAVRLVQSFLPSYFNRLPAPTSGRIWPRRTR